MSGEDNKKLVRRYYEEVLEKRNPDLVEEIFANDYTCHYTDAPSQLPSGLEGVKKFVTLYLSGFSNLHFTIEEQIASGDMVATRLTGHSSNPGAMRAAPEVSHAETARQPEVSDSIARPISIPGMSIERIANGKIAESWGVFDLSTVQQELGGNVPVGRT